MSLTASEADALLSRCARQRTRLFVTRFAEAFGLRVWPGLVLLLCAFAAARALHTEATPWAFALAALWIVLCLLWTLRKREAFRSPHWLFVAFVDSRSGATGALMRYFERRDASAVAEIPRAALSLRLGPELPWRLLAAGLLTCAAFVACAYWPVPVAKVHAPVQVTALPVARAQRLLERIVAKNPQVKAFVTQANKTVAALQAKQNGLSAADFDALERIEQHAKQLLAGQAESQLTRKQALKAMDDLLAAHEAKSGDRESAEALAAGLESMRDALSGSGLDEERVQALIEQARQREAQQGQDGKDGQQGQDGENGKKPGKGSQSAKGGFDAASVRALREQIGQLQSVSQGQGTGEGDDGSGGPSRGPGAASLQMTNDSKLGESFEANTFETKRDPQTVVLSTSLSKREEAPKSDAQDVSGRQFEAGSDTQYWYKHLSPSRRAVLERYFEEGQSDE